MWPERLLQVSQTIREIADDEVRGELFRLAQMRTPRTYSELSLYDSQFKGVIRSLMKSAFDQIRVAESLATPLGTGVRDAINGTITDFRALLSLLGPSGSDDFSSAQEDLMNADEVFNALPVFDFVVMSRVSDLSYASSRLSMEVEEMNIDPVKRQAEDIGAIIQGVVRLWEMREPSFLVSADLREGGGLSSRELRDLDVGSQLVLLRELRKENNMAYLKELTLLVHASVEQVRGARSSVSLNEFYDRLSCISFFLDVGFKGVMFCFAELLERGWIGGLKDVGGRQMLEIKQPELGHLEAELREAMEGAEVTTDFIVNEMNWDYFTALHIVKKLERQGDLVLDEGSGGVSWHWGNNGGVD